jgi:putative phosphonate catabolism associated alcohol dehydrogenase
VTTSDRVVELSPAAAARVFVGVGRALETIAVPRVVLAPGDVLMTVELATVCGSDVHTVSGHRSAPTPLVLGHEYVGRVLALGETQVTDVEGRRLAPGDRVVWSILAACGRCDRCVRGLTQKCREVKKYGHERLAPRSELTGGFATHTQVRAGTAIVRVDEHLAAEVLAPLACGTATAWAALAAAEAVTPLEGATVLVCGAGLIGLTAAAIASDRGARVVAVDPDPRRRERALLFGASAAIGPGDDPRRALAHGDEITVVVEASGAPAAIDRAIDVAGVGAVIVLVGSVFPAPPVSVDAEHLVRTLLTLRGVHNYTAPDLAGAARWLQHRGRSYPFAELVGATYPLDALDDALAVAATGTHVRVGVAPAGSR